MICSTASKKLKNAVKESQKGSNCDGRRLDLDVLEGLEVSGEFMEFITGIGFDWLLVPDVQKMPIELAQEFFTSFHFTSSTDVGRGVYPL